MNRQNATLRALENILRDYGMHCLLICREGCFYLGVEADPTAPQPTPITHYMPLGCHQRDACRSLLAHIDQLTSH